MAIGLFVGFIMGWIVAWIQESEYRKQRERNLHLSIHKEQIKVRNLEFRIGWLEDKIKILKRR